MQYFCSKDHFMCITSSNFCWYPPNWGIKCGKAEGVWWWVSSLGGSQGQKLEGLQAEGLSVGLHSPLCTVVVQLRCVQHSGTAPVCAVQWYSTCVCSTVVQHLCVQYSGTAPVCAVPLYRTHRCCTVVQHLCVQYSGTALVCAVPLYCTHKCCTTLLHTKVLYHCTAHTGTVPLYCTHRRCTTMLHHISCTTILCTVANEAPKKVPRPNPLGVCSPSGFWP